MPIDPLVAPLVVGFAREAAELSQRLTRELLQLERATAGSAALAKGYEEALGRLHTLKGSAATLGLEDVAHLVHELEDLLHPLREELKPIPTEVADRLLKGLDNLLSRTNAHAEGSSDSQPGLQELLSGIVDAPESEQGPSAPPIGADKVSPDSPDESGWRIDVTKISRFSREVERLREIRLRIEERRRELKGALASLAALGRLAETARVRSLLMILDHGLLMDVEESGAVVEAVEDGIKAICTLPLRTILDPLQRAVRDLCRLSGKEARLSVVGAEVSLDRRVLDALRGALVHLIRNAVDHGVELPTAREARGKHREGALVIRVEQQGNMVFLEVADDGNGINLERVRQVALTKGLMTADELTRADAFTLHRLIFRSGFSTATQLTETSGRGVGLDVVRSDIEAFHGTVEVESIAGQGTRFILAVPMDLGSCQVLLVRAGEYQFGIPVVAIERTTLAQEQNVRGSGDGMKLQYLNELLGLRDLGALLSIRQSDRPIHGSPILIVQAHGQRLALMVDEVLGYLELVIRPLPSDLGNIDAYQGASTLARGELLLVLRPDWLVLAQKRLVQQSGKGLRKALVVDDSLTARALHRAALESGGFIVHAASSAYQALNLLKTASYDVLVSDIGMEGMDGFELTSKVRSQPETQHMPVVLVSARDSANDRERGMTAGADGYLTKKDCAAGRLLNQVSDLIQRRQTGSTVGL